MHTQTIQQILQRLADTKTFLSGAGCRKKIPDVFQQHFPGATAVVVADENTFQAAGREIHELLKAADINVIAPFVFPGKSRLHAEYEHIETLREFLREKRAIPVAVGSGTINDLAKRAAYENGSQYMVVATACSVDGYSSFSASILKDGFKEMLECPAPLAIIADTEILRQAPPAMTAAGYADLASKLIAGSDWMIADTIGSQPILPDIWEMSQRDLRKWIGAPEKLRAGHPQAIELLFEGLTMAGFAMQAMHNTRPAAGSEHLFNHLWEMQHHRDAHGLPVSHGFKVAIGTLASTALTEVVFSRDIRQLDIKTVCTLWKTWEQREADIRKAFQGTPIVERVLQESHAKYITAEQLKERLQLIVERWDEMRENVRKQLILYQDLKRMFMTAGCPVTPEQINLGRERVREAFFLARMIRNRYGILDLAYELNWLEECVNGVMDSETYFKFAAHESHE